MLTIDELKKIICLSDVEDKFNPPIFVFDNTLNCEWFKKRLLEILDVPLFNLKVCTIEDFIVSYLDDNLDDKDKKTKLLDLSLLTDLICKTLIDDTDGKKYYEIKAENSKNAAWKLVKTFIESHVIKDDENSKINYINLYDLSKTLSSLFCDYMLHYLKDNAHFDKFFDVSNIEGLVNSWQNELFNDVIRNANLNNNENAYRYDTLYNRFKSKVKDNNLALLRTNVYYFSQNFRDKGNPKLGNFYKDVLWQIKGNNKDKSRKLIEYDIRDLEECLSQNYDKKQTGARGSEKLINLISAPSKIREIEGIHSVICNLISQGKIQSYDDILILAPNINEYKTALHQVFSITKGAKESKYPYIPISLSDIKVESDLSIALKIVFSIAEKGYYTRQDFFKLADSALIKKKYGIDEESIKVFETLIDKLSVYRNRKNYSNWQNALYRVLLYTLMDNSKVTTNSIERIEYQYSHKNENTINPFSTIGVTTDILASFSSLITWFEDWCAYFKLIKDTNNIEILKHSYSKSEINSISSKLAILFDVGKNISEEDIKGEVYAYISLVSKLNTLLYIYSDTSLPHQILKLTLCDSIQKIALDDDLSTFAGIRATNISLDSVFCCKYLFLIGMSSANFSISSNENVLDIRGDDFLVAVQDNKKSIFEMQLSMCKGLCVSFVDKNLKKDEDFYLAPEVQYLIEKNENKKLHLEIDENRDITQLWTAREFRLKSIGKHNSNSKKDTAEGDSQKNKEYPLPKTPILISDIKKFLTDPFQFQSKQLFGEKSSSNIKNDVFEPVEFDNIVKSEVIKQIIKQKLNNKDILDNDIKQNIKKTCINLPDGRFFDVAFQKAKKEAEIIYNRINDIIGSEKSDKVVDESINLCFSACSSKVLVKGTMSIYNKNWQQTKELNVFDFASEPLNSYITALCLMLYYIDSENKQEEIKVNLYNKDKKQVLILAGSFSAEAYKAEEVFNKIIKKMFVEKYQKCVPYKIIADDLNKVYALSFVKFIEKLKSESMGVWGFFDNKKLFEPEKDCGFSEYNFKKEWKKEVDNQRELFLYLDKRMSK